MVLSVFYKNIFIGFFVSFWILVFFSFLSLAQEGERDFRILSIQKDDVGQSVSVSVLGDFIERDIINIYINGEFINSEAVNTEEELSGNVVVSNIALTKFIIGTNTVRGRLQRDGNEILVTLDRSVIVEDKIEPPTVILEKIGGTENTYKIQVSGDIISGDTVAVFTNGEESITFFASEEDEENGKIVIERVEGEDALFTVGDNYIQAEIRRGQLVSPKSSKSEIFLIEEEMSEETTEVNEEESKEASIEVLPKCFSFSDRMSISSNSNTGRFGENVSVKGSLMAVTTDSQRIFLYEKHNDEWKESSIIEGFRSSGSSSNKFIQVEIVSDKELLVGVPYSDKKATNAGLVQRYIKVGNVWKHNGSISPQFPARNSLFGSRLAVEGDTLVVSSVEEDASGKIYIYKNIGGNWLIHTSIIPSTTKEKQNFGNDISISNGVIAVGAPGSERDLSVGREVFIYTFENNSWSEYKLNDSFTLENTEYALSVLIDDNSLFVSNKVGQIFVYTKNGSEWTLLQKLEDSKNKGDSVISMDVLGNIFAVGYSKSDEIKTNGGIVFIYKKSDDGLWELFKKFDEEIVSRNDRYGNGVYFDELSFFVSSPGSNNYGEIYKYDIMNVLCENKDELAETEKEKEERIKKEIDVLKSAINNVILLISNLQNRLQKITPIIPEKIETYVFVSPDKATLDAQRRAAEQRGIIGPGLPYSVKVKSVDKDDIPGKNDEIKTRDEVIKESKEKLGIVVPIEERTLRIGDTGDEILRLQIFLNNNGFPLTSEGHGNFGNETRNFDQATQNALSLFQAVNGLESTGELDAGTRKLILRYIR